MRGLSMHVNSGSWVFSDSAGCLFLEGFVSLLDKLDQFAFAMNAKFSVDALRVRADSVQ